MVDGSESDILFDDPKTKSKKRPTRQQKAEESNRPGASGKTKGEREMQLTTTLNKIQMCNPCSKGWKKLLKYLGKTVADD